MSQSVGIVRARKRQSFFDNTPEISSRNHVSVNPGLFDSASVKLPPVLNDLRDRRCFVVNLIDIDLDKSDVINLINEARAVKQRHAIQNF